MGKAVIMTLVFENIRLKDQLDWHPYISHSKCNKAATSIEDCLLDNGKIISCGRIEISLTDVDYQIIMQQYDFDWFYIKECMFADKAPLPDWFISQLREWYTKKVQLKTDRSPEGARRYMESKQHLNACYGMTATAWNHAQFEYDFDLQLWKIPQSRDTEEEIQEQIDKMAKPQSQAFLRYDIGLYVTAYARKRLFRLLDCFDPRSDGLALYCDTDSGKGQNIDRAKLDALNSELLEISDRMGFTIPDPEGKMHPIGVFELDGTYDRFSALHAKCYAYEHDGKLGCTIAGVTRDNGKPDGDPERITSAEELGSLEELEDGKIFTACGGTRAVYIDHEHDIYINGQHIHSFGGCAILNTTYEIGGTNDLLAMYGLSDPELPYK